MTHRFPPSLALIIMITLALVLSTISAVLPPSSAHALSGSGTGIGYRSTAGWWLGTYRLDDGSQGFCLNVGKPSPTGHDFDYGDGEQLGWFTPEQSAQLAYISRNWAETDDRVTAAAGQLATWYVAGLGDTTLESLASRAGKDAATVLSRAHDMISEAARAATTGIDASATIEIGEGGTGRLRIELTVARLSGSEQLPPGAHQATVRLSGATLSDGSDTGKVETGKDITVVALADKPELAITAHASSEALPYGNHLRVAVPRADSQAVLMAVPASATTETSVYESGPSPLPFQPVISTKTSASTVTPHTPVNDTLDVSVQADPGLLSSWGVHAVEDRIEPMRVAVESTLYGPYSEAITPSATIPDNAPVACSVTTTISDTGSFNTEPCTLVQPGFYVWTERIDPTRLTVAEGRDRLRPWNSSFGQPSEVTVVVPQPQLAHTGSSTLTIAVATPLILGCFGGGAVAIGFVSALKKRRYRSKRTDG